MKELLDLKTDLVAYVGEKAFKTDTVCGTSACWAGYGDVQEVPSSVAQRLIRFPRVFVLARDLKAKGKAEKSATTKSLGNASTSQDESPGEQSGSSEDAGESNDVLISTLIEMQNTNDPEAFSEATGKPKIDVVRSRTGNPELTPKELNAAWKQVSGE